MKYRKKPVAIDAFKFDGTVDCLKKNVNKKDWNDFAYGYRDDYGNLEFHYLNQPIDYPKLEINSMFGIVTLEGMHKLSINDYVIKGVHGEYYPCKPDIFEETYEKVE